MSTSTTPTPPPASTDPTDRRCIVCKEPRLAGPLLDAIAHAQCDQRVTALDPQRTSEPGFWESIGAAG